VKILVSAYTGLGNLIMKTPMLQILRDTFPKGQIDLITDSEFGTDALLKNANFIDNVISLSKTASSSEKQRVMKDLEYDLLLIGFDACPPFLHKMALHSPIKKIVRHRDPKDSVLGSMKNAIKERLFSKTEFVRLEAGRHETLLNIDLLESISQIKNVDTYGTSISSDLNNDVLSKFGLLSDDYILIQPGAANGQDPTKTWHPDNWIKTIGWLFDNTDHQIVICGDKGDREFHIEPIVSVIVSDRLIDSSGETSIDELISLIAHSRLLLCHDSGIMHIADALGKNLITLFGPSDASRTKPLKESSIILYSETEYFNAKYNFKSFSVHDLKESQSPHYPMSGITIDDVKEKVKETLSLS